MTWGVVMMEHPFVCNVWFHANDPFFEPFKDVFIKSLVDSSSWRNKFCVEDSQPRSVAGLLAVLLVLLLFCYTSYTVCTLYEQLEGILC